MGLNNIFALFGIYRNASVSRLMALRIPIALVWTLITSLSVVGWSLMYDESYSLPAKNFFALWAIS